MPTYYLQGGELHPLIPITATHEPKLKSAIHRYGLNPVINSILDTYYRQPQAPYVTDDPQSHGYREKGSNYQNRSGVYQQIPTGPSREPHNPQRRTHGALHAARTTALVQRFHNIHQKHKTAPNLDQVAKDYGLDNTQQLIQLTQVAAAFHDSARLDEGKDYWDKQSSDNCQLFLKQHGINPELASVLQRMLQYKDNFQRFQQYLGDSHPDNRDRQAFQYLHQLIRDSDTLEVMRARPEFYIDQLQSYKRDNEALRNDIKNLVAEHMALLYEQQDMSHSIPVKDSRQNQYLDMNVQLPNSQAHKNRLEYHPDLFTQVNGRINNVKAPSNSYQHVMNRQNTHAGPNTDQQYSQSNQQYENDSILNMSSSHNHCSHTSESSLAQQRQQLYNHLIEKNYRVKTKDSDNYKVELEVDNRDNQTHTYEIETNHSDNTTNQLVPQISTAIPPDKDSQFYQNLVQTGITLIQDCLNQSHKLNTVDITYQSTEGNHDMSEELADAIVEAAKHKQVLDQLNTNSDILRQKVTQHQQARQSASNTSQPTHQLPQPNGTNSLPNPQTI